MALRGRKPKSVQQKMLTGNPDRRPLSLAHQPPQEGALTCPAYLTGNESAMRHWNLFLQNCAPNHLSPIDAPLLARLCQALAWAEEAASRMGSSGVLVKAPNGGLPLQSPFMAIVNRQTEIARKLTSELALSPAERNRICHWPVPDQDDPDEFY